MEQKKMTCKTRDRKAFELAFNNFWNVYPNLKGESIMYMYTCEGVDWFKHSTTRQDYKVNEASK